MRRLFLAITLFCFCGVLKWNPLSAKVLEAATTQAGVAATDNVVQKKLQGQTSWASCQVGDILTAGDRIRTGADSSATLMLADKSLLRLSQNTEIVVVTLDVGENYSLIRRFQVMTGRLWSDVIPGAPAGSLFEVQGPNAVAAVKGTAFEVGAEQLDETEVNVFEGSVECVVPGSDEPPQIIGPAKPFNQFRAQRRARARLARLERAQLNPWQTWNLERRAQWLAAHGKMPGRVRLQRAFLQNFQKRYHRRPPSMRRPGPANGVRRPGLDRPVRPHR